MQAPHPSSDDVVAMVSGLGRWLTRFVVYVRRSVTAVAVVAAVTGLVAVVLAVAAWQDAPVPLVLLGGAGVLAVVLPWRLHGRLRPLFEAAAHPDELTTQAQHLFGRVRDTADVRELLRGVAGAGGDASFRPGLRGAFRLGRLAVKVVDDVGPDPAQEPLLAALGPATLRGTWFRLVLAWWSWLLAGLAAFVSAGALAARAIA